MTQLRAHSALEALANVAVGAQVAVFPLFGIDVPLADNLAIGAVFTVVSLVRSYLLRRAFNAWDRRG